MKLLACALAATLIAAMPVGADDDLTDIFVRYEVPADTVPPDVVAAAAKHFACTAETIRTGVVGYQLSEESGIWDIPCRRLAHGVAHVLALVHVERPHEHFEFVRLPAAPGRKRASEFVIVDPRWNLDKRTVASFVRGGPQGDCGTYEVFKSDAGAFELVELREKPACDGTVVPPTRFPLVFPQRPR